MTNKHGWATFFILLVLTTLAACRHPGPPVITAQPADQSVLAGTTATFDVVANNATGYQWQRSTDGGTTFTDVNGATATSHTTAVTTLTESGTQYRVTVSGARNSVTSSAVTLTVTPVIVAPTISVHPANQSIIAGQNASFTVTAGGSSLSYQWQRSTDGGATFTNVAGETNATLTLTAVPQTDNAHQFRVVVSNSAGSETSSSALLTVNSAQAIPVFSTQPVNRGVVAPDTAVFSVIVTGNPSPTLQWQLSTNAGGSFVDIAGATASSYTTSATGASDNGNQYRVIASNSAGTTTSDAATLTVAAPEAPRFIGEPITSVTAVAGLSAELSVGVTGTPAPSIQWQLSIDNGTSWNNITGETSTVLSLPAVPLNYNGHQFRAVASNTSGSATSLAIVLIVSPPVVPTYQFNLFGYNAGPSVSGLRGGSVMDETNTIQCSGYWGLSDLCPRWRADFARGTVLRLTATAWPGWRVSRWIGGGSGSDCGFPVNGATNVTVTINHNTNCRPEFEVIPGSTFILSAVPAGPWAGRVAHVVAIDFGALVIPDSPLIDCGPFSSPSICDTRLGVGNPITLKAFPITNAPVGQFRWTCNSLSPHNASNILTQTISSDITVYMYGDTSCSAEFIPTL